MTHAQEPEPAISDRLADRLARRERERNEGLQQRVRELEETVHYLYKTLQMHGLLTDTEASVGDRMCQRNEAIRRQTGAR